MAVRFIIGRAGSGKTYRCVNRIVQAMRDEPMGPPIYWLLPKQATFMAERELTCASRLGAFCRTRIVSFDMLGRDILADCGGGIIPEVTALGRQMILGHLLRKHQSQLRFFTSVARQAGLAARLDATFAEIERCGNDAADLATLLRNLQEHQPDSAEGPTLDAKLHDLHLIYEAYCAYLGQERLDPHRRLTQVLACLKHCSFLRDSTIYVDGFADFTEFERRVLAGLAEVCREMEITLLIDPNSPTVASPHALPDDLSVFHRTEEAYRRLWFAFAEAGIAPEAPVLLGDVHRPQNPDMAHIERAMFDDEQLRRGGFSRRDRTAAEAAPTSRIEFIEAPDRRAEVDAAARCIRSLLNEGLRLRDIGVILRDLGPYHELIEASFLEHDIPCFVDRRRAVAHHPLMQFIRNVFLIAQHNWPQDAVMTLLKSGLAAVSLDEADEVENYLLLHRLRGSAWTAPEAWQFRRDVTLESEDEDMPAIEQAEAERVDGYRRRIVDPLRPFIQALSVTETMPIRRIVVELFALFERFGIRQTLARWMQESLAAEQFEQHGEHEQVWSELIELFDQLVDLLGEEEVTLADFLDILDSGLEQFDLALTPQTVDQVLVGQIDRTRSPEQKAVIVMGLAEGSFPLVPREDSILSDTERRSLLRWKLEVGPDSQRQLLDENLFGYVAFTRASQRLYATRPTADDAGRPLGPSPFWRRLRELFPDLPTRAVPPEDRRGAELIGTPRQLVTSLMRWVRQQAIASVGGVADPASAVHGVVDPVAASTTPPTVSHGASPPPPTEVADPWPALYQWLSTHDCCGDGVDTMRSRAWRALSYSNTAALSPEFAAGLFPSPLHASVTRIETFATCPFKHFVRYGLALCAREDPEVTRLDLGNVYHAIMEKIVRQMLQQRTDWTDLAVDATDEMIGLYAAEIGKTLRGELMLSTARNKYLLQRIEKTLRQVIAHQRALRQRGQFRPAFAELGFGVRDGQLPAFGVRTPKGRELLLHGKIDRVDLMQDQAEFAVIDYKLSGNALALDRVYHGISLQLLTYLLVLRENGQRLTGRPLTPVAAFYLQLLRKLEDAAHPEDAIAPDDPRFNLKVKPRGIFDGRCIAALDGELDTGRSDVVQAYIKKDGQFGDRNRSDMADAREFSGLLDHVQHRLGQLADEILAGKIDIAPYRINRVTPCPHCEFRDICRFDPSINRYHTLSSLSREDVLRRMVEGTPDGA